MNNIDIIIMYYYIKLYYKLGKLDGLVNKTCNPFLRFQLHWQPSLNSKTRKFSLETKLVFALIER